MLSVNIEISNIRVDERNVNYALSKLCVILFGTPCILIQIDASNFVEFELSEFEISRVDCIFVTVYEYKSLEVGPIRYFKHRYLQQHPRIYISGER